MWQGTTPSRRLTSRIEAPEDVWVRLQCNGHEGVFRVRRISSRGVFIESPVPWSAGAVTKLDFLVPEGHIRADVVVRYAEPNVGIGLEFTAVREEDRPKLAVLLTRLRNLSRFRANLQPKDRVSW